MTPGERPMHIVWDWNGTLFADVAALIESTIEAFSAAGLPPVTAEGYRRLHTQPIPACYERLAGRSLTDAEQRTVDAAFQAAYLRRRPSITLDTGARSALRRAGDSGLTQSLLSMHPHRRLVPLVRGFGIDASFVRVDGQDDVDAGVKRDHLNAHLRRIGMGADRVLLIGDSVDDARAAAQVGACCVLYASGLHAFEVLAEQGVPVADSLDEALAVGAGLGEVPA